MHHFTFVIPPFACYPVDPTPILCLLRHVCLVFVRLVDCLLCLIVWLWLMSVKAISCIVPAREGSDRRKLNAMEGNYRQRVNKGQRAARAREYVQC
jgi:hypothetical protein